MEAEYTVSSFPIRVFLAGADFHRRVSGSSLNSYKFLLKALDPNFKSLTSSEVYRVRTGWIAQGLRGYHA